MARVVSSSMPTLLRPPPGDESKSSIENVLELTQLVDIDKDLYTNTRPLWRPPGARGIYGGAVIAQCLAAAQNTVPKDFTVHSMHCYFVLAGNADIPIVYHVEHVREGRSYMTRTVQARQRGRVIFTTTLSFMKEKSGGARVVEHAVSMPFVPGPDEEDLEAASRGGGSATSPFQSQPIDILNNDSPLPHTKRTRQWIKARGTISPAGGHEAHLAALAYMSDSYFIGTVSRVHKLWRSVPRPGKPAAEDEIVRRKLRESNGDGPKTATTATAAAAQKQRRPEVGMMVSLDHTIYFHNPRDFRADDWIFTEMESPWSGDGRGLVFQKMWTRQGKLIATCVQEGVVRLKQDDEEPRPKPDSKL